MQPAVYIVANRKNGALYVGVTSDLKRRAWEHRQGLVEGFSKRYGLKRLVYFELHPTMASAIQREKQLKAWKRAWKIDLIQKENPNWNDLFHLLD
ncbi:GIY-YIG nuclease family protein [Oceanithermus profundus]|uniref:Excinuclease ABC C subunit domain protein n=1 Tax=Oceanithermus profundus (strain DSM 14977 / NBRC 100410 / VKM B-2274 / 506) TaxID=670487 RepID=E4U972_OCEP5|nr:GIY-YIG nuclease family protein [Oceanithermus profundus]ADR36902.1 Excinuclease ABC C subunit domain protein [Oceanithermus profundus DSM 14977]